MGLGSTIISVAARQVFSDRGHPGLEATVKTQNGATGVAICTAGISVGSHEVEFVYDGGTKWRGRGVQKGVDNVHNLIAPALIGMNAAKQLEIDDAILNIGGPGAKARLGGNATAAVSAAVLKAGAASLDIPLYQHIGGVNACTLPVPGEISIVGSDRYGGGKRSGGKPSYSFMAYGFDSFSDASYAVWDISTEWRELLGKKFRIPKSARTSYPMIPAGLVQHDRELWDLMVETLNRLGYEGKVGFQVDVAAETYYEREIDRFVGLFSSEEKTKDDLMKLYQWMAKEYPFLILEDPLHEDDYEGHAILTRELGIQIVGDDLFTTNPDRLQKGIELGAANTVLLKVNQIGTISEAFEMVQLAYRNGYGVMPCDSRGEGEAIADYSVGLNCGTVRESATGPRGNRFLQIEAELGRRARFLGKKGLKGENRTSS
ncbi:MAG: enolase C-terminal domain-like protein [Thermodesulfobacteriota bacterium]|jgi:enolase